MRSFAVEVLGLRVVGEDTEHLVELSMGDGAKLELFGSAAVVDKPWLFESNPVVAGFLLDAVPRGQVRASARPRSSGLQRS
jgi:hypothetical protein